MSLLFPYLPYLVLASHLLLVVLVISLLFKNKFAHWVGRNALSLVLLISITAVAGSLFYSEIMGFEPCVLCWWQRVFIYPIALISVISLWKKQTNTFLYIIPLAILSLMVSLYQTFANFTDLSLLPCTALGGACSKVYVMAFGYITIPVMSLTISLFIIMLWWAHNVYRRNKTSS